jgi:cellulose biosynthesis protein BcsQ
MSPKIITLANTAGGSGKTTLAHALSVAMVEYGKKTLLIDMDPRGSLTFRVGREGQRLSLADFLAGTPIRSEDLDSLQERIDFIAADSRVGFGYTISELTTLVENLPKDYDLVIIDTPSDINAGLIAAIAIADLTLIPYSQTIHHMRGIAQVLGLERKGLSRLIQIGNDSEHAKECAQWEHLDSRCELSDEIERAALTTTSVLTVAKDSVIAAQIRECAYSALELLEMD